MRVGRTAKRVEYQMKPKEGLLEGSEGSSSAVSQEKFLARVSPQGTCWIKDPASTLTAVPTASGFVMSGQKTCW
ncbi:hypothetical protein ABVK25_009326 [Lepraria finkii]|uniref:Uncharacterized protein n=1 Tax=Lepraria finkii TaxID=1340010 RepID=A0ABR4AXH2_9LECA